MSENIIRGDDLAAALINIPKNTVKLSVVATMLDDDDKFIKAHMDLGVVEVIEARIEGEEWLTENGRWVLTDKGREMLEEL